MASYKKLFGTQYFITNKTKKIASKKSFDIIFYNGGSGNFIIFKKIVRILLNHNFKIRFIIGPLCKNFDWIITLSKKNKLLSYSINTKKIIYEFSKARLVVASAGTSTYELNISQTPSILFKALIFSLLVYLGIISSINSIGLSIIKPVNSIIAIVLFESLSPS